MQKDWVALNLSDKIFWASAVAQNSNKSCQRLVQKRQLHNQISEVRSKDKSK